MHDTLTLLVNVGTLLGVAIAAYSIWAGNRYQRRKDTMDHLNMVATSLWQLKRSFGVQPDSAQLSDQQIESLIAGDDPERGTLHEILSTYEYVAVGANTGLYDVRTLDRLIGGNIIRDWGRFGAYVLTFRRQLNRTTTWSEFETLAEQVRELRSHTIDQDMHSVTRQGEAQAAA